MIGERIIPGHGGGSAVEASGGSMHAFGAVVRLLVAHADVFRRIDTPSLVQLPGFPRRFSIVGPRTCSSDEALAVARHGRHRIRSFSEPTLALASTDATRDLPDGSQWQPTTAVCLDGHGARVRRTHRP